MRRNFCWNCFGRIPKKSFGKKFLRTTGRVSKFLKINLKKKTLKFLKEMNFWNKILRLVEKFLEKIPRQISGAFLKQSFLPSAYASAIRVKGKYHSLLSMHFISFFFLFSHLLRFSIIAVQSTYPNPWFIDHPKTYRVLFHFIYASSFYWQIQTFHRKHQLQSTGLEEKLFLALNSVRIGRKSGRDRQKKLFR